MGFMEQFYVVDIGYDCTTGMSAINLNELIAEPDVTSLKEFYYRTSFMLALAQDFISGRYVRHGAHHEHDWCFWGAVTPPDSILDSGEFIFRVSQSTGGDVHYKLCIHGNEELRQYMEDECRLHADLSDRTELWSSADHRSETAGPPFYRTEHSLVYQLTIPAGLTLSRLDLLPKSE